MAEAATGGVNVGMIVTVIGTILSIVLISWKANSMIREAQKEVDA